VKGFDLYFEEKNGREITVENSIQARQRTGSLAGRQGKEHREPGEGGKKTRVPKKRGEMGRSWREKKKK